MTQLKNLIKAQEEPLVKKMVLRTALAEAELPVATPDDRPAWYAEWEDKAYNNPESVLRGNSEAGYIAAAIAGVPTNHEFRPATATVLKVIRGAVYVAVNSTWHKWPERSPIQEGDAVFCSGMVAQERTAHAGTYKFHKAGDPDTLYLSNLNTFNFRFATEDEITAFVKANLDSKFAPRFLELIGDVPELQAIKKDG